MAEEKPPEDLNLMRRRLYAREEPAEVTRREEELHRLGLKRQSLPAPDPAETLLGARYKNLAVLRAKRMGRLLRFSGLLALVLVIAIVAVTLTVVYRATQTVSEAQVNVSLAAPAEFTSGSEITYVVRYTNESRVDWTQVELILTPPRGFTWRDSNREVEHQGRQVIAKVGDVASGQGGDLQVRGQLIGEQNETAVASAEIFLTPANYPSGRFSKQAVLATAITALPLDVSLDIAGDAASGERVLATINVRNLSSTTLTGGYLRLLPAPGLELALTDSEFSPGFAPSESQWLLPDLEPLAEAKRTFIFQVEGQPGEKRALDIEAGVRQGGEDFTQRELMHVVTVSATEVIIEQLYNGSTEPLTVRPGETVSGEIRYHNTGSVGLKDVIVKVVFEGSSFDAASLTLSGAGSYDPVTKSISWSAATVPELGVVQPQQAGSLKYSFKILPLESLPATSDESQVLVTMATVDSPNLPAPVGQPRRIISDRAVLSLGTNLILEAAALYDDGRLGITSTGPRPPRVGETTTYTVRWRVGSTLNDVSDIQLVAVLPDGVRYTGQKYVTSGEVTVNDRTGEVGWRLPLMAGQTGRTLPHQELHVQVAITPGEDKRGEAVTLLNKVTLTAVDEFVDEAVEASLTQFPTTETASPGRGTVQ